MHKMVAFQIVLLLLALAVGKTNSFSPQFPGRPAVVPSATRLSVSKFEASMKVHVTDKAIVKMRIDVDVQ